MEIKQLLGNFEVGKTRVVMLVVAVTVLNDLFS